MLLWGQSKYKADVTQLRHKRRKLGITTWYYGTLPIHITRKLVLKLVHSFSFEIPIHEKPFKDRNGP